MMKINYYKDDWRASAMVILGLCLFALPGFSAKDFNIRTDGSSGISISLKGDYDTIPLHGFYPMHLTILNKSTEDRTWKISAQSSSGYYAMNGSGLGTEESLSVNSGEQKTFEIFIPLSRITDFSYSYSQYLSGNVSGPGVISGGFNENHSFSTGSSGSSNVYSYLGISKALHVEIWGQINSGSSKTIVGTSLQKDWLPGDWRGYVGIDSIWYNVSEWTELSVDQRSAMLDWVATGGCLNLINDLAKKDIGEALKLPGTNNTKSYLHSFGEINIIEKFQYSNNRELGDIIVKNVNARKGRQLPQLLSNGYDPKVWGLRSLIPRREIGMAFISLFLLFFSILVGPVNLLYFARGNKRYRLFITTPIISIATTLLLIGYIYLKDGVGGTGVRYRMSSFFPGEKKVLLMQNQITQTGMLTSSSFDMPDNPFLTTVGKIRYSYNQNPGSYNRSDGHFSGDWFKSRSEQEFYLQTIRDTRSSLVLAGKDIVSGELTDAPVMISSIDAVLEQAYYRDHEGKLWKASSIALGQQKAFSPATESEFTAWWNSCFKMAGEHFLNTAKVVKNRKGQFYAWANNYKDDSLNSLESIRWKQTYDFMTGEVIKADKPNK